MWFAGSYCVRFKALTASDIVLSVGVSALATSVAFMISNGSFYLLSGRFPDLSWMQYMSRVAQYYLPYTSVALCYAVLGLMVIKLVKAVPALMADHKAV
jgi:hypothetical protein